MRKMILLASALALGGVASAQDTTTPATPAAPGAMPAAPDASAPATPPATPDAGAMPAQSGMSGGSATPPGSATGPNGPVSMTPTQGPTDLPPCTKSVTDNCKQAGGGGHAHKAMHHKKKK